ncbi:hypothetical protein GCM10023347_21130 [Streptomyces chumphonensis]|uniref:Amidotransferase n=1 Tax=Streptomyces chumphonensis TaxID=1214925 RepID=A0A927EX02_9ACTN|nr:hypothetical protein [Streptomyces chumphonensis]MBD3930199.1 hypothetical protein [Streptomyces chumphonensis]
MNGVSTALVFVGLFLLGGAISFWRQGLPKGVVGLLGAGSALALIAGILRLEVWQ